MFNALSLYHTDDEDWQPRICTIQMPDGKSRDLSTWAPFLVGDQVYEAFTHYGIDLRTLIARCMADDGEDRPTLDELLAIIQYSIARDDVQASEVSLVSQEPPIDVSKPPAIETDALLQRFFREYFLEPQMRPDPYVEFWDGS
ncbi:hypothetical protein F5Y11DRAFT_334724 [Daldinia sp. FL1419]|nr:hypothetical protein F5Y11DRAFT_334724 [Daldinia sp. FL1419]